MKDGGRSTAYSNEKRRNGTGSSASSRSRKASLRRKRRNKIIKTLLILFVIVIAAVLLMYSPLFSVRNIEISGNNAVSSEEIYKSVEYAKGMNALSMNKGSIIDKFTFDYEEFEEQILNDNGKIAEADVSYSIGGTLSIKVKEAVPVAIANTGDEYVLLDRQWVIIDEYSYDPIKAAKKKKKNRGTAADKAEPEGTDAAEAEETDAPKEGTEKTNTKKKKSKKAATKRSDSDPYDLSDLIQIEGLKRSELRTGHTAEECGKEDYKLDMLDAVWSLSESDNDPFSEERDAVEKYVVENSSVVVCLKRDLRFRLGDLSLMSVEEIDNKVGLIKGILNELTNKDKGLVDMFSSEKPTFSPDKKKKSEVKKDESDAETGADDTAENAIGE